MGKDDNKQVQKQVQKAPVSIEASKPTYEELQMPAWAKVEESKHTGTVKTAKGVVYSKFDKMDIRQLRDELKNDTGSKSDTFNNMYESVDNLINLAKTGGKRKDEVSGQELSVDFFETFYTARLHVNHYVYTHEGFHWTGKGERRLQISKRISAILKSLNDEIENYKKSLPEDKARMLEYRQEGLPPEEVEKREEAHRVKVATEEMMKIVNTGEFGPKLDEKQTKKLAEKWLVKGYSTQIKELLEGATYDELKDKDDFLAFIEDLNNRIMANKIAIDLMVDKAKNVTCNTPWIKDALKKYLGDALADQITALQPDEIADKARTLIDEYTVNNSAQISRTAERIRTISDTLHVSVKSDNLFEYPLMKEIIESSDDSEFVARVESLKDQMKQTDDMIADIMNDRFSIATRDKITKKLFKNLGSLRIFGETDQILDQCDRFLGMLKVISPLEYHTEMVIENTLKSNKIDLTHRDSFVKFVSGGDPRDFYDKLMSGKERVLAYIGNAQTNNKTFQKKADSETTMLTSEQWDAMEQLNASGGEHEDRAFKQKMAEITGGAYAGEKISRREYLTRRSFKDAQKKPEMIRKVKAEQKRIKALEGTCDARFMAHLCGFGQLEAKDAYRKLDSIYTGQEKQLKVRETEEKELLEERTRQLRNMLREHKMSVPEMKVLVDRFTGLMSQMNEIRDDMNDDEKAIRTRENMERFGAADWDEVLRRIDTHADAFKDGGEPEEVTRAKERYEAGRVKLSKFKDGKYKLIEDLILNIPDMYAAMMSEDGTVLDTYMEKVLEPKLGALADSVKSCQKSIPKAVYKQYVYTHLDRIYADNGKRDVAYYNKQLDDYSVKVFKVKPDGQKSARDNIDAAEKAALEELKKLGIKGPAAERIRFGVLAKLYGYAESTEDFLKLYDRKALISYAKSIIPEVKAGQDDNTIESRQVGGFKLHETVPSTSAADQRAIEKIEKTKQEGLRDRYKYLGLDSVKINKIRTGKSLVRVKERGDESVSLNMAKANKMRGLIQEYCGELELPQTLIDALVEQGASQSVTERMTGTRLRSSLLYKHAFAMSKMYDFLREDRKDDPAMTPEEAQMFIVKSYGESATRKKLFETAKGPDVGALRNSDDYKKFREDYKKLLAFESVQAQEPSVAREQLDLARMLRTVLITGTGLTGMDFSTSADNARKYIERSSQTAVHIRQVVEDHYKDAGMSELYIDAQVDALREYYMKSVVKEAQDGKDYNSDEWAKAVREFYGKKLNRDHIIFSKNAVSSEDVKKTEASRVGSKVSEKEIAEVIKLSEVLFHGRLNKYEKLDEDQKKLFAVGLMMMDKGAIGLGTAGTTALLAPKIKGADTGEEITEQIKQYVSGGTLNVRINYREALYKLINYGKSNIFDPEGYTFSVTAYDKALQFARAVSARRNRAVEKDIRRMAGGRDSIDAAYAYYNKKQQQHVLALGSRTLTVDDVRKQLLAYAKKDQPSKTSLAVTLGKAAVAPINIFGWREADKTATMYKRMSSIQTRLNKLSDSDLKVFVRLMQERTVLDKSVIDTGTDEKPYIEQEKRTALTQALSADSKVRAEVLEGFDDSESCKQALVTALSFKLRDDMRLDGKALTKDCFDKDSFKRETLVDWTIVENALDLMDEIAEKKMLTHAMANSSDYLTFADNKSATDAYEKLHKDKKNGKLLDHAGFDKLIKEHADKDDSEDISRALAGYHALTDKEKNLFFRVLARRDLLDISRKNYMASFFGKAEREYANKAGRDALIDEYINSSLEGNIGIQLDENAYYKAMGSLFSTQISDRTKFSKTKDLSKIFAYERNFVMGRKTAVDWKLFKRALQFVNRASEELEYVEGNAQLYRAAGNMSKNGHINMDYSFLRKNFHRTGNHWARKITNTVASTTKDMIGGMTIVGDVKLDTILEAIPKGLNIADKISDKLFDKNGLTRKGVLWLKKTHAEAQEWGKAITTSSSQHNIQMLKVADPELTEEQKKKEEEKKKEAEEKEKLRREELDFYGHMQDGIDNIIAQSKSAKQAFDEVASYVRTNLVEKSEKLRWLKPVDGVEAGQNKDNIVVSMTKGAKTDNTYGDIRDTATKVGKTAKDVVNAGVDVMKMIPGGQDALDMISEATRKVAYKFLNDAIIGNEIDLSPKLDENGKLVYPDELKLYQQNAETFAHDMLKSVMTSVVGEEGVQQLLDAEEFFYGIKDTVSKTMTSVIGAIRYAKKCADHVKNIAVAAENIYNVKTGSKNAKAMREEDDKKLKKASQTRLTASQKEIVDKIVAKHRGLEGVAEDVVTAVMSFNIAEDVLNLAVETVSFAGAKLNAGSEMIAKAIKAGIEFAMYAARLATDRVALNNYFRDTDAGRAIVDKLSKGFDKTGSKSLKKANVVDLVDVISDARGYEHTSELIENTGMSVAQSIVFSASEYNPMVETKLMAITVMSVMGLDKEIGSTDPSTVEKLFKGFKMSR